MLSREEINPLYINFYILKIIITFPAYVSNMPLSIVLVFVSPLWMTEFHFIFKYKSIWRTITISLIYNNMYYSNITVRNYELRKPFFSVLSLTRREKNPLVAPTSWNEPRILVQNVSIFWGKDFKFVCVCLSNCSLISTQEIQFWENFIQKYLAQFEWSNLF